MIKTVIEISNWNSDKNSNWNFYQKKITDKNSNWNPIVFLGHRHRVSFLIFNITWPRHSGITGTVTGHYFTVWMQQVSMNFNQMLNVGQCVLQTRGELWHGRRQRGGQWCPDPPFELCALPFHVWTPNNHEAVEMLCTVVSSHQAIACWMNLVCDIAFIFQININAKFHCFSRRYCQHRGLECFM